MPKQLRIAVLAYYHSSETLRKQVQLPFELHHRHIAHLLDLIENIRMYFATTIYESVLRTPIV